MGCEPPFAQLLARAVSVWRGCGSASFLNPGARIGRGKAKLLESIRDTGSISAAAREMGMSYKRAWMLLDSTNQTFTEPVTAAAPGGVAGGGASLTLFGAEVLERYNRILERAATNAVDDLAALACRATRGRPKNLIATAL